MSVGDVPRCSNCGAYLQPQNNFSQKLICPNFCEEDGKFDPFNNFGKLRQDYMGFDEIIDSYGGTE